MLRTLPRRQNPQGSSRSVRGGIVKLGQSALVFAVADLYVAQIDLQVCGYRFSRFFGNGHIGIPEYLLTTADILGPKNLISHAGAPIF